MTATTLLPAVQDTPPAHLSVRFFGQFTTSVAGERIERWRAGKSRAFFQFLMQQRGRVVTCDRLRDELWPEAEWRSHSSSLKVACCGARSALGASKDSAQGDSRIRLLHQNGGYVLDADDAWCDTEEFQQRFHEGMQYRSNGNIGQAVDSLRAAVTLYQSDFLVGQNEDWVTEAREYYRSLAVAALDVLRSVSVERGDMHEVLALGQRTLEIDALHEPTYQDLISVSGLLGHQEQAMRWFQLCERRLKRTLGVEPSSDTQHALYRALGHGRQFTRSSMPLPSL